MDIGHFYFIDDQYFIDFPDSNLMQNKEMINSQLHGRPCYYAFEDKSTGLFWIIPISSQVPKYRNIYKQKVAKYGRCDTILFGRVLGYEKAFLIQNMCPITPKYIASEYVDKNANAVRVDTAFEHQLLSAAKKVLALQRKGAKLIFPDVLQIESALLK